MKEKFLKTIYFDHTQLGITENIEKLYEDNENDNFIEQIDTNDEYISNIPAFQDIEELELSESITYFI
jgi:hypothetical protein